MPRRGEAILARARGGGKGIGRSWNGLLWTPRLRKLSIRDLKGVTIVKLVIVESPGKAKTINKYLGKEYLVLASMGHVRDLPLKKLGVDVENGFKTVYVNTSGRLKVIADLKAAAKKCDEVILAPDPDREGEAIAWHLFELLKGIVPPEKFSRVTYNEITKPAIMEAFSKPGELDMKRA